MNLELMNATTAYWKNFLNNNEVMELETKVKQMSEELKIVNWYLDVFEDGNDTRDILNMYSSLKIEFKEFKNDAMNEIEDLK